MYFGHDGYGMGGFMWIFWILIIVLVVFLLRSATSRGGNSSEDTAEEILRKRLASGEISEEEFKSRLKVLEEK